MFSRITISTILIFLVFASLADGRVDAARAFQADWQGPVLVRLGLQISRYKAMPPHQTNDLHHPVIKRTFANISTGIANILADLFNQTLPLLAVSSFGYGLLIAIEVPVRQAFMSELIPRTDLSSATSLHATATATVWPISATTVPTWSIRARRTKTTTATVMPAIRTPTTTRIPMTTPCSIRPRTWRS